MLARNTLHLAPVVVLLLALPGCGGGDGRNRQEVAGQVTLDGAPLESGSIEFQPTGGRDALSGGAVIAGGAYTIGADRGLPPGEYRVRIFSADRGKNRPSPGEAPGLVRVAPERVPPQYNAQTKLTASITEGGENTFDFDLTSN